jgi:hypothetical protein
MSRITPPQFDDYGRTFWIPSQVEPCVALIGTSVPALRQFFVERAERFSTYRTQKEDPSVRKAQLPRGLDTGLSMEQLVEGHYFELQSQVTK